MPSVWLVAPAFARYEVSAVTFAQWALLREQVAPEIDLNVVVVSNDLNLYLASAGGFHTLVQDNSLLGRRYNDGFQYALEHGADFACDAGSRNLIHPDLLRAVPWTERITHSANLYSLATAEGVSTFDCRNVFGRGPMFLPRAILERWPRPVDEDARELIMHSICDRVRELLAFSFTNVHDFQYVGLLRPDDPYVTSMDDYVGRWGVARTHGLDALDGVYEPQTVDGVLGVLGQPVPA